MLKRPAKQEIDHRTIKLLLGLMALTLANLTAFFSGQKIDSISASYYAGGWAQSIFVGFLFAIAALLMAYNGQSVSEMVASKVASLASLCVALFPCQCGDHTEIIPHVHATAAAVMFMILAFFCWQFYKQARGKGHVQARRRCWIYALCGIAIVLSMGIILAFNIASPAVQTGFPERTIFYGERTGLMAFGISWLTASHILPVVSSASERYWPFGELPAA